MATDLSKAFVNGDLNEQLYAATLFDGEEVVFNEGFGRLYIDESGRTRISLCAQMEPGPLCMPAEYFSKKPMQLRCMTQAGLFINSRVQWAKSFSLHMRNNVLEWELVCPEIILLAKHDHEIRRSSLRALIEPVRERIYLKGSTRRSTGFDPVTELDIDWSEFTPKKGINFSIAKGELNFSILKASAECDLETLNIYVDAFLKAISLALGRRVRSYTRVSHSSKQNLTVLFPKHLESRRQPGKFPLLPLYSDNSVKQAVHFIEQTTDFFIDNQKSSVMTYVGSFFDALLVSWQSACLHLTTGVEGLSGVILKQNRPGVKAADKAEQDNLKEFEKVREWLVEELEKLKKDENKQRQDLIDRFIGEASHLKYRIAVDSLLLSGHLAHANITRDEALNWKDLRNLAAHGEELDDNDSQTWDMFYDSLAVLYRLACALVGWHGTITEYGVGARKLLAEDRLKSIAVAAYFRWLNAGCPSDSELKDWVKAEHWIDYQREDEEPELPNWLFIQRAKFPT